MSYKQIRIALEQVKLFQEPKIQLEQYATSAQIALEVFSLIEQNFSLQNKTMLDLGAGTGILSIAAEMFGTEKIFSIEIDQNAIEIFKENLNEFQMENIAILNKDVIQLNKEDFKGQQIDFVVMNPPFGTKNNENLFQSFLEKAVEITNGPVYFLHKDVFYGLEKKVQQLKRKVVKLKQFDYDIQKTHFNDQDFIEFKKQMKNKQGKNSVGKRFSHKEDKIIV